MSDTKKAIVCPDLSAAGTLRRENIADYVPNIFEVYTFIPTPQKSHGLRYFKDKAKMLTEHEISNLLYYYSEEHLQSLAKSLETLRHFDSIELWIGRSFNDHIFGFHFLTMFANDLKIMQRLKVNILPEPAGTMNSEQTKEYSVGAVPADDAFFAEAQLFWEAYRSPTPMAWFKLLTFKSKMFPNFPKILRAFLRQLPLSPTNLRQVDLQILSQIGFGTKKSLNVIGEILASQMDDVKIHGDDIIVDAIFKLSNAHTPAISGLAAKSSDLYSDQDMEMSEHRKFMQSKLSLTEFGKLLLITEADWRDYNETDYWWCGTHVTDTNFWAFDPETETLIAP